MASQAAYVLPFRGVLRGLVDEERRALHYLLSVMAHGEEIARQGAKAQAKIVSDPAARDFLHRQARHEHFHALVFRGFASGMQCGALAPVPVVLNDWRSQIMLSAQQGRLAESLLVQQVYLEGLGHIVLEQIDNELSTRTNRLTRLRGLILRQEQQHHEFGLRLLRHELRHCPEAREQLEPVGAMLFEQAAALLRDLSFAFALLDADDFDYLAALKACLPDDIPGVAQ